MPSSLSQDAPMSSTPLDCSVIILNWNNAPDTLECLASVFASQGASFNVYVADNGSTDDSLNILKQAYPDVTYIANGANLGFAEGNNRAIQIALQAGAPFLFLLNNDAVIHPHTLHGLQQAALTYPSAAVLGPKIYYYDQPTTIWFGGGEWDPSLAACIYRDGNCEESSSRQKIEKTGFASGCAFFIRASVISRVGLMDPRFFLNWEEVDWCWRIRKAGYDCLYVPQAKCWHKISRSFIGGSQGPMWLYFRWRNLLLWMELHLTRRERMKICIHSILPTMKTLLKMAFRNHKEERAKARAALRGILDYLLRRFGACPSYTIRKK